MYKQNNFFEKNYQLLKFVPFICQKLHNNLPPTTFNDGCYLSI